MKIKERVELLERINQMGNRVTITKVFSDVTINTCIKMIEELKCCNLIELKYRKHKTYSQLTDMGKELLKDFDNREQKLNKIISGLYEKKI